ncbi:MAG: hypothetical protein EOO62_33025, partial [Hymenobacter sp.]
MATEVYPLDPTLVGAQLSRTTSQNPAASLADLAGVAGGAPQWVAGAQKAGALTFDNGIVYLVKANIANGQARPAAFPAGYLAIGPYDDASIVRSVRALSDQLDVFNRLTLRWDLEKKITLNNDSDGGLQYYSGQTFAITPGSYAAGIIRLSSNSYGLQGDFIGVRIAADTRDQVFNSGAARAFHSANGPTTIPA